MPYLSRVLLLKSRLTFDWPSEGISVLWSMLPNGPLRRSCKGSQGNFGFMVTEWWLGKTHRKTIGKWWFNEEFMIFMVISWWFMEFSSPNLMFNHHFPHCHFACHSPLSDTSTATSYATPKHDIFRKECQPACRRKVFLMPLGGGVFNNPWESICSSMANATLGFAQFACFDLLGSTRWCPIYWSGEIGKEVCSLAINHANGKSKRFVYW